MAGQDQKTEKPTHQRLQKARKEGQFPQSRDFLAGLQFITAVYIVFNLGGSGAHSLLTLFQNLFHQALDGRELDVVGLQTILRDTFYPFYGRLLLVGFGLAVLLLLVQLAITGGGLSAKQLMPKLKRLNPASKLSQMPKDNLVNVIRSCVFLVLISLFLYYNIKDQLTDLANLPVQSLGAAISRAGSLVAKLVKQIAFLLFLLGVVDLIRQRAKFQKSMKMSKEEIKREMKDSDGNQQQKQRIRRLQRDAMRRNMVKAVAKSTVVITNPTHYAIAIQYEMGSKAVPTVVAKGKNYLAKVIRDKARENEIPIIENKPLAQALYQAVDVGNEIPTNLYKAVAEVLAQIYRIINRR